MSLFFTMLPIYLFGNFHCVGMCGPLVMMLGQHRYRYFYFFGRLLSFMLAGMLAGEVGAVLGVVLRYYHLSALTSFLFGGVILVVGVYNLMGWQYPGQQKLSLSLAGVNRSLSLLMLRDQPWPSFLFGFFTIFLPCGQTIVVFSACALSGDMLAGMLNGFAFALLTSPSLLLAMHAQNLMGGLKRHYNTIMGICALFVGILAIGRGLAELDMIPHWVLNPEAEEQYHIVIY